MLNAERVCGQGQPSDLGATPNHPEHDHVRVCELAVPRPTFFTDSPASLRAHLLRLAGSGSHALAASALPQES